jgi:hypothetical protein
MLCQFRAGSTAAHIHSKRPNANVIQFAGNTNHIGRAVTSRDTVQQKCDTIVLLPVVSAVIMQHESVAIAEVDLVLRGAITTRVALDVGSRNRLQVSAGQHQVRAKWWNVHYFKLYSSTLR